MTWAETVVRRRAARVRPGRAVWPCRAAEAGAPESGWLSQELDAVSSSLRWMCGGGPPPGGTIASIAFP
jgi:hypothetical protein